jgi:hypothetical protein
MGPRIRRTGNREANEVLSLEQPVRWGERRSFGQPRRRRWLQRIGDPCSWGCFTARETEWRGGSAVRVHRAVGSFFCSGNRVGEQLADREPRAVRLVPVDRATETTAAASWRGRPVHGVDSFALGNWGGNIGFIVWATRAVRSERSRGKLRGRTGFMASGSMDGARFIVWETG